MPKTIYISGMGIISSIGFNQEACLYSLQNGNSGICTIEYLKTNHRGKILAGEVKATNRELYENLFLEKQSVGYSRTSLLGLTAAREAFQSSHLNANGEFRLGLISSTSVGGIDQSEDFYKAYQKNPSHGRLSQMMSHDCGDSTEIIASDLGIRDYVSTICTACSSSANAIMLGARLVKNDILDQVIVGGTDALTRYTLNGFNALKILSKEPCKPFDEHRNGLNLGEGAAYLVLEMESSMKKRNHKPIGRLLGYGNANDAFHQTASSPQGEGALKSMGSAMMTSGMDIKDIDYINAHGTATYINDLSEGTALKTLFNSDLPPFSSTKPFTGHTLAASGAIEAVISMLMLNHHFLVPNLNFTKSITSLNITPVTKFRNDTTNRNVISNSFGFGGNCTSLIFSI